MHVYRCGVINWNMASITIATSLKKIVSSSPMPVTASSSSSTHWVSTLHPGCNVGVLSCTVATAALSSRGQWSWPQTAFHSSPPSPFSGSPTLPSASSVMTFDHGAGDAGYSFIALSNHSCQHSLQLRVSVLATAHWRHYWSVSVNVLASPAACAAPSPQPTSSPSLSREGSQICITSSHCLSETSCHHES